MPDRDINYWRRFAVRLYTVTAESDLFGRAAQSAFYFSLAIFPFLLFVISIFGIILRSADEFKYETYAYVSRVMPGAASELVRRTIDEVASNSTGGKLTIALIVTLWSASAGVDGIRAGLNAVYGLRDSRMWLKTKVQSLLLTILISLIFGLVLTIVFYGWNLIEVTLEKLRFPLASPTILIGIQWVSTLLLMLFAFEVIYNLLPDFKKRRWRWVTPGSIAAIVLWLILTTGFRIYISYFNSYDRTYGSLGAVIILMFWLYLTALVVMVGGAINTVTQELHDDVVNDNQMKSADGSDESNL
jgi:membrane protein